VKTGRAIFHLRPRDQGGFGLGHPTSQWGKTLGTGRQRGLGGFYTLTRLTKSSPRVSWDQKKNILSAFQPHPIQTADKGHKYQIRKKLPTRGQAPKKTFDGPWGAPLSWAFLHKRNPKNPRSDRRLSFPKTTKKTLFFLPFFSFGYEPRNQVIAFVLGLKKWYLSREITFWRPPGTREKGPFWVL